MSPAPNAWIGPRSSTSSPARGYPQREKSGGLWNGNDLNNLINAHTPFFLHAKLHSNSASNEVTHNSEPDSKQRTHKQRQKEQRAKRAEVNIRADRSQTSSHKRTNQAVRSRNRKARDRCEHHGQAGAQANC